ncbi:MAG: acyl-CoA/acyl-ACP dehydrogenase [Deltaproteobacteria bacterium]|nr:acyl-CoA/acyl-ACP dehydrogenase [Deltaproteobacteria bacterium]MBW2362899.1 acyl-CoA/acyl-ACP dehydrogenase [Deltaproteobacteria bacterium]
MNFGFTEEQELLRAEVRKFLDRNCPLDEVRKVAETPEGFSRQLWGRMAELGWVGLLLPEKHGGAGLGWVDLVVVLEEAGRSLLPSPLISSVLAGAAIALGGDSEQQSRWLPDLAAGTRIGTLAFQEGDGIDPAQTSLAGVTTDVGFRLTGEKLLVADASAADLFVVAFRASEASDALSLAVVPRDAPGLGVEPHISVDLTKPMGRVRFDAVEVSGADVLGPPGSGGELLQRLIDCGATAVTAELVGAAEAALALTVNYAKERVQFDSPIGRFQSVKHPLAEMYVDIESTRSLCYYAAWLLDENPSEAALAVSRAKALASERFPKLGIDVVQLHGGIGFTWEYDAHLYLKRAKWGRPAFGDADWHFERIVRLAAAAASAV